MIFTISNLLAADDLDKILSSLEPEDFIDGKLTAGWAAKKVKHNTQLDSKVTYGKNIKEQLKKKLIEGTGSLRGDTELKALLYKVFTGLASKTRKYRLCKGLRCFITR